MINRINTTAFKIKFATLLSKLYYSASLSIEQISYKIAYSDVFGFVENNDINSFMGKQYSELIKEYFNASLLHESNDINPVYWAGLQYINLLLDKKIPLNQLFILCPLKEMVSHYEIYHEMNETQLIEEFMNNEYKRSLLSLLIKHNNTSYKKLSVMTGISINTLKYYSKSNDILFKTSFDNIVLLMKSLNVKSMSLFQKESSFINVNSIFEDEEKRNDFIELTKKYLNIDPNIKLDLYDRDYKKKDGNGIYIGVANIVRYKNTSKVLNDSEVLLLMRSIS